MDTSLAGLQIICNILTIFGGVVVSQGVHPSRVQLAHKRITGPAPAMLLPNETTCQQVEKDIDVFFGGLLYPCRKAIYDPLASQLSRTPEIKYSYRPKHEQSWEQYLDSLARAKIVVHTSCFSEDPNFYHLNNKAMEAPLFGCLLVCQPCPEIDDIYGRLRGYVPYNTWEEALDRINHFLSKPKELKEIAEEGQRIALAFRDALHPWPEVKELIPSVAISR